jgi:predicted transposase YbfD/YdcC
VRAHRAIENALHWQLDVSFREDGARNRTDTGRTTSPSFDAARWTWPGEMDSRVRCQSS